MTTVAWRWIRWGLLLLLMLASACGDDAGASGADAAEAGDSGDGDSGDGDSGDGDPGDGDSGDGDPGDGDSGDGDPGDGDSRDGDSGDGEPDLGFAPPTVGTVVVTRVWEETVGGNGHRYRLISVPEGIDWRDASAAAEAAGGYLVTVTHAAENGFVFDLATELPWPVHDSGAAVGPPIGGQIRAGLWSWVTGETWSYTGWAPGEPSNWSATPGEESVIQMRGFDGVPAATWNDATEDGLHFMYVIELGEVVLESEDEDGVFGNGCATPIEWTPTDLGSDAVRVFSVLPSDDPGLFGITGSDVRAVDFDVDASGATIAAGRNLTDEYSSIGVTMNSITIRDNPYQGAASPPNAAWINTPHIYSFNVPVRALGLINTSPDHDELEVWSGPNRTGTLLLRFRDQFADVNPEYMIDRFVGARACEGDTIGSLAMYNATGNLELDELIFEVAE